MGARGRGKTKNPHRNKRGRGANRAPTRGREGRGGEGHRNGKALIHQNRERQRGGEVVGEFPRVTHKTEGVGRREEEEGGWRNDEEDPERGDHELGKNTSVDIMIDKEHALGVNRAAGDEPGSAALETQRQRKRRRVQEGTLQSRGRN